MKLNTHSAFIKTIHPGDTVGYGRTFTAEKEMQIATILLGYADGIPRQLSNRWYLTVNKAKAPIVGRICMDQIMLDVSEVDSISKDDEIVFFGDPHHQYPSLYTMAELTNGFHYELLCGIGKRIPRVYKKQGKVVVRNNTLLD